MPKYFDFLNIRLSLIYTYDKRVIASPNCNVQIERSGAPTASFFVYARY